MPSQLILPADHIPAEEVMGSDKVEEMIPQRYQMRQLDGILVFEPDKNLAVGYKSVEDDEFWVKGHIPGRPLLPGVLMCECAAQLCTFYYKATRPTDSDKFLGFGGMDKVRFRGTVVPGDRFVVVVKAANLERRLKLFEAQGLVDGNLVFEANISGVEL